MHYISSNAISTTYHISYNSCFSYCLVLFIPIYCINHLLESSRYIISMLEYATHFSLVLLLDMFSYQLPISRSSRPDVFCEKEFLEISQNSQENTRARVSFLIKLQAAPATSLKRRLWHRCFPVNFAKFLRTSFFTEHLWWLLLYIRPLCLRSHCINNSSKLLLSAHRISYQVVLSSI